MKMTRLLFSAIGLSLLFSPYAALAAVPSDPLVGQQWYLDKVKAFGAWDTTTGSNDVIVAVLDTGVDFDHPDLEANLWTNHSEIPSDGQDNDGNGFVDDIRGWDFVNSDNTPDPMPDENSFEGPVSHGTVIAGIIGAVGNNGVGVTGINWRVRIMPVRILDADGSGFSDDATAGILYAVKNGAKVINLSFTGTDIDPDFLDALRVAYEAGVTVVAAVGNTSGGGTDIDAHPVYPACFFLNEADLVLGVAASTKDDLKTSFSNYGSCVDISAPGIDVFNTSYHDTDFSRFSQPYLGNRNGTSIAAPMVAGAVALVKGLFPSLTPLEIKSALQLSVDPMRDSQFVGKLGAGRLNITRALEVAGQILASKGVPSAPVSTPVPTPAPVSGKISVIVSSNAGQSPFVSVYDGSGLKEKTFEAYASAFKGGVRVAVGDVNGDGTDEIITAPGPGGGPHVRIFTKNGIVLGQFFAFETTDRRGLFVSAGDVDGDGKDEIVVGNDTGGGNRVRVFRMDGTKVSEFKPFDAEADRGVRVAVLDTDGNGSAEIVATKGDGASPRVRVLSAAGALQSEFLAYASTFMRGVFLAGGDLDGNGTEEIVTGTGTGGGPQIRAFDGRGGVVGSFFAFDSALRGGVRVAVANGKIAALPGPLEGTRIRLFDRLGLEVGGFVLAPGDAGAGSIAVSSR